MKVDNYKVGLLSTASNTAGCKPNFLIRISGMNGSKCLLIHKCTQLKYAGTHKDEMKDREAEARSLGLLNNRDADFLEWITILVDHSFLVCESEWTVVSLLFCPSSLIVLD